MTLTGTEVRATARIQLLLHTINVPKHPKLDDLLAISGEEGSAGPSDLSASWLHFKESTAVHSPLNVMRAAARDSVTIRSSMMHV
jgi:hypothetical protein